MKSRKEIITNSKLGRLTIGELVRYVQEHELFIETPQSYLQHGRLRECTCECGNIKLISEYALNTGRVKSCGCLRQSLRVSAADKRLEKMKLVGKKSQVSNQIRIEQARLKTLKLQPIPYRDENAIEECATNLRSLFGQRGILTQKVRDFNSKA
jgi:hypothetical protein